MAGKPDALDRYLANRFPTANPTLPTIYPDGTTIAPGHIGVPYEEGMGQGPGGTGTPAPPAAPVPPTGDGEKKTILDWRAYLENWGFDPDIVNELDRIFRTYPDADGASHAALAYIRGTDWYAKTFPGIQAGEKLGIITNERDYRSYTNNLNDVYQRYYGRNVTGDEVSTALGQGRNPSQINAHFEGQAYIAANKNEIQYDLGAFDPQGQLSDEQLGQLGDQQAGLDNAMGQILQKRVSMATQKLQTIFGGTLATPSTRLNGLNRLLAPSLGGGSNTNDIAS